MRSRRPLLALFVAVGLAAAVSLAAPWSDVSADGLPSRLSDRAFWQMIVDFSEPGGTFRSDNLVSNERAFQVVIPDLRAKAPHGGVYVGVGPDQNFTYISALEPRIAFIIDIRRQNMLLHLMYKAVLELSRDRVEFASRLFSRPRPPHLARSVTAERLFEAFAAMPASDTLFRANLRDIQRHLVKHHGFGLTEDDLQSLEYVYRAFYQGGPDLRYSFPQEVGLQFPTYADLMQATDRGGHNHSYMASEANFKVLREIERRNLLVPLVGDFGGAKAIRRVGAYVREHGATVSTFYTSNVEQYLFQGDTWQNFAANVETMPLDDQSVIIRSFFNLRFRNAQDVNRGPLAEILLDPIVGMLNALHAGQVRNYYDVVQRSR